MYIPDRPRPGRQDPDDTDDWFGEVVAVLFYPVVVGWFVYVYFLVIRSILTVRIHGIPFYLALAAAISVLALSVALFWFRDIRNRLSAATFQILVAIAAGVYGVFFVEDYINKILVILGAVVAGANGLGKFRDIDRRKDDPPDSSAGSGSTT